MATEEGTIDTVEEPELVQQIEAMRDDPEAWGEPTRKLQGKPKSERRQRGAMVSVRFSPDELASVQAHAVEAHTSVSGYLRNLALNAARQPIVSVAWVGVPTVNAPSTEERLVVREDEIPAW